MIEVVDEQKRRAEHVARVEKAGCLHPALYLDDPDDGEAHYGWCMLCRAVHAEEPEQVAANKAYLAERQRQFNELIGVDDDGNDLPTSNQEHAEAEQAESTDH